MLLSISRNWCSCLTYLQGRTTNFLRSAFSPFQQLLNVASYERYTSRDKRLFFRKLPESNEGGFGTARAAPNRWILTPDTKELVNDKKDLPFFWSRPLRLRGLWSRPCPPPRHTAPPRPDEPSSHPSKNCQQNYPPGKTTGGAPLR